jgi:4-hydroxy-2-oxoheptanedioate aldolase
MVATGAVQQMLKQQESAHSSTQLNTTATMRTSRVLEKLRAGQLASSFKINLESARAAELMAACGFDCIWADMEHTATDWSLLQNQIWASKSYNVDVMVRVARGCYSDYIRPLELDCTGIMVPHVMNAEDARRVVRMTRFHPTGLRPIDGGNADGAYCRLDLSTYLEQSNREKFLIVQIEDPEALDELDAIAAVEGIDMLFFGPGDYSHALGVPGQANHPKVSEARQRVAEAAHKHGKYAGTVGSLETLDALVDGSYRFINIGVDVIGLAQYASTLVEEFSRRSVPA